MTGSQHFQTVYVYKTLLLVGLYAASIPHQKAGQFSFSSILDAAMPVMRPVIGDSNSTRCETLKSFFGISYEQMQVKNETDYHSVLNIDLYTKNGNIKYNLTSTRRLTKLMKNATSVVILIHGFMESSDGLMVQGMAPELSKKSGVIILALDGRKLINLEYFRSSTYARFMGEKLGTMLGNIIKNGEDPSKIHLIGHSLGAQIAGITGKRVLQLTSQPLGRITALDPAGPCFSSVDKSSSIDQSDAAYVDVIHSNGGILGVHEPVGHKDFYPNGGKSQPGCYLSTCDHTRAWELFAESITAPDRFPARSCTNWTMFRNGQCAKKEVAFMGLNSESGGPGTYFLTTASSAPFGLGVAGSS